MNSHQILLLFSATILCIAQVTHADSLSGVYGLDRSGVISSLDASCPDKLEITESGKEITGADIKVDGTACTAGEATIGDIDDFLSEEEAESGKAVFDKFVFGRVSSTFDCGDFSVPRNGLVFLVSFTNVGGLLASLLPTIDDLNLSDINFSEIAEDAEYLIFESDEGPRCLFNRMGDSTATTSGSGSDGTDGAEATAESTSSSDNGNECFPASASVRLQTGDVKTMAQLRIGDIVQTGHNTFSPIFAWTHQTEQVVSTFVQVKHSDNDDVFRVTPNHFVYRYSGELVLAKDLVMGDVLISGNGAASTVESVELVRQRGLYNPQTVHGDIVVDGVRASTYTLAVEPKAAHALLSPVRAVFKAVSALQPWSSSSEL